jgi:4'-phosphopantetheinyl transferase
LNELDRLRNRAPPLTPDAVHLWPLRINAESWPDVEWTGYLSEDERSRAQRFRFPIDAYHFSAARALLRIVLAGYVRCDPRRLIFGYAAHGKPFLPHERQLHFNLSHSGGGALIGVTLEREIGVDVEAVRADVEVESIAQQFFSGAEQAALASLPQAARTQAFFDCWTRKEAFVKARGEGLSLPLDQFDVSLQPGAPAQLLATRPDAREAAAWELLALDYGAGYAAAVMTETGTRPLSYTVIDASTR